jgi:hypothetical protein
LFAGSLKVEIPHQKTVNLIFFRGRKASAKSVLCDHSWFHELGQVFRPASFRTSARHFKSTKRMAINHRARATSVDVEVSDFKVFFYEFDVARAS